jgi:hypothetical protein
LGSLSPYRRLLNKDHHAESTVKQPQALLPGVTKTPGPDPDVHCLERLHSSFQVRVLPRARRWTCVISPRLTVKRKAARARRSYPLLSRTPKAICDEHGGVTGSLRLGKQGDKDKTLPPARV